MNKCIFHGRVGTDPEVRQAGNSQVANFSFAVSKKYRDNNGQQQEKVSWLRIVAWEKLADVAAQYFQKGSELILETEVEVRKYADKDGVDRTATDFILRGFTFCGSKRESDANQHSPPKFGGGVKSNPFADKQKPFVDESLPF